MIPEGRVAGDQTTLREWVVDLGHSAHQGIDATKRLLRHRLWFPGMDREVERIVGGCLPCQASVTQHHRDPLKPSGRPNPLSRGGGGAGDRSGGTHPRFL